jgi:hypothetical protein
LECKKGDPKGSGLMDKWLDSIICSSFFHMALYGIDTKIEIEKEKEKEREQQQPTSK